MTFVELGLVGPAAAAAAAAAAPPDADADAAGVGTGREACPCAFSYACFLIAARLPFVFSYAADFEDTGGDTFDSIPMVRFRAATCSIKVPVFCSPTVEFASIIVSTKVLTVSSSTIPSACSQSRCKGVMTSESMAT